MITGTITTIGIMMTIMIIKKERTPCNASYYRNRSIKANVLASDVGIVAKAGGDKTMHIFLNNILSTDPISGFYN